MFNDTTGGARIAHVEAVRRLGASGRLRMAAEMSEDARRIAIEAEGRRHPNRTTSEARLAVLGRIWGVDLAARATRT